MSKLTAAVGDRAAADVLPAVSDSPAQSLPGSGESSISQLDKAQFLKSAHATVLASIQALASTSASTWPLSLALLQDTVRAICHCQQWWMLYWV